MRNLLTHIAQWCGRLFSIICPSPLRDAGASLSDHIYTGMYRKRFAAFGKSVVMRRAHVLRGLEYISVGDHTIFEKGLQLTAGSIDGSKPKIVIGNHCLLRKDCHITAVENITIGDHLLTGTNVLITDNSHGDTDIDSLLLPPRIRKIISKGSVTIGHRVWLGNNVCLMPGVSIGDGAVVGSNSVVTKDIPAYSVAAGIPARIIKTNIQKK